MARRLKTIARWINENLGVNGFRAEIERGFCNTDRKLAGTRLRIPGQGRWGNRLMVYQAGEGLVFDHNSAETYRCNDEVEEWLAKLLGRMGCAGKEQV